MRCSPPRPGSRRACGCCICINWSVPSRAEIMKLDRDTQYTPCDAAAIPTSPGRDRCETAHPSHPDLHGRGDRKLRTAPPTELALPASRDNSCSLHLMPALRVRTAHADDLAFGIGFNLQDTVEAPRGIPRGRASVPLAKVATQRLSAIRFVSRTFERSELRTHSDVGLELPDNVVPGFLFDLGW